MALTEKRDRNPAAELRRHYEGLMAIDDLGELKRLASELVTNSAISEKNLAKWHRTVSQIGTLDDMQAYITNYLLAADGLRVYNRRIGEHDQTRQEFR